MYLTTTTAKVRVSVSGSTGIKCHVSWIDFEAGIGFTPGVTNTSPADATTTDVSGSPTSGKTRAVKEMFVFNTSASETGIVTVLHTDGTTEVQPYQATLSPGAVLHYVEKVGFVTQTRLISTNPSWASKVIGTAIVNPGDQIAAMQRAGNVAATPTNITVSIARCSLFVPPVDLDVTTLRWYGVGATTNVYRVALYRFNDLARITAETPITTVANQFGSTALAISLTAGEVYFLACSVNATGTTAGVGCVGGTVDATTGQIQVAPTSMPGYLYPGNASESYRFQFPVTTGALPDPAAALVAQAAWTGGMPAFWLDNSSAAVGGPVEEGGGGA